MPAVHNYLVNWVTCIWCICTLCSASAQPQLDTVPPIVIRNKILEQTLKDYVQEEKATVIAVILERYDNDYTYTLYDYGLFDQVKRNPTSAYGKWQGITLLFYTGLEEMTNSLDTFKVNQLIRYLRPRLPDGRGKAQLTDNPNITSFEVVTFDPSIWRFKVRDGKLLWLRRRLAYQSERVPYIK